MTDHIAPQKVGAAQRLHMVYRKGELSKAAIDREWPYQVALPAEQVRGSEYVTKHEFCRDLSLCTRGHTFQRDGRYYVVFCFAEKAHADLFRERFGGECMDPKDRPRWPGSRRR